MQAWFDTRYTYSAKLQSRLLELFRNVSALNPTQRALHEQLFLFQHCRSWNEEIISLALGTPVSITAKTFKSYKGVSTMHLRLNYSTDFRLSISEPHGCFPSPFDPSVLISEDITAVVPVKLFLIEQSPSNAKYHMNFQQIKLLMIIRTHWNTPTTE